jgi:hypothetical protein
VTHDDQDWRPATFQERGVAVPFTSPALAGTRVRRAERRCDLLVPHPGGGRGIYVLALPALAEFCAPTLHDLRLAQRLATLHPLCPAGVRAAAQAVALEGAAGRAACAAARAAMARDRQARQWHEHAMRTRLDKLGHATMAADIEALCAALVEWGLDAGPGSPGRGVLLLAEIEAMGRAMSAGQEDTGAGQSGDELAACALSLAAVGRRLMAASVAMLGDAPALLEAWARMPGTVAAVLARLTWLLDGWDQLCLIWRLARDDGQLAAAAIEIRALIPPIPPEAESWFGEAPDLPAVRRACGLMATPARRRPIAQSSQAVWLVARNERLRALAA